MPREPWDWCPGALGVSALDAVEYLTVNLCEACGIELREYDGVKRCPKCGRRETDMFFGAAA